MVANYGIGAALIAFGIKFSIDHGCRGDVVFDAKSDELARHYAEDFHARQIPSASSGGPKRFLLADEGAWNLFSKYFVEEVTRVTWANMQEKKTGIKWDIRPAFSA